MSAKRKRLNIIIVAVSICISGIILFDVFLSNVLEDLGLIRFIFALFLLINIGRLQIYSMEKKLGASILFNMAIIIFTILIFFSLAFESIGYSLGREREPWAMQVVAWLDMVLFVLAIVDMAFESDKKTKVN